MILGPSRSGALTSEACRVSAAGTDFIRSKQSFLVSNLTTIDISPMVVDYQ